MGQLRSSVLNIKSNDTNEWHNIAYPSNWTLILEVRAIHQQI